MTSAETSTFALSPLLHLARLLLLRSPCLTAGAPPGAAASTVPKFNGIGRRSRATKAQAHRVCHLRGRKWAPRRGAAGISKRGRQRFASISQHIGLGQGTRRGPGGSPAGPAPPRNLYYFRIDNISCIFSQIKVSQIVI